METTEKYCEWVLHGAQNDENGEVLVFKKKDNQ
jgi:hypothetical protein